MQDFLDTIYDFDDFYDWTAIVWDEKELPAGFQGIILDNSLKLDKLSTPAKASHGSGCCMAAFLERPDPDSSQNSAHEIRLMGESCSGASSEKIL